MFAGSEFRLQQLDRTANHAALQLNDTSVEGNPAVHGCEKAKGAFAAYVCGFNSGAVFQDGQQRQNAALGKIRMLEKAARFANDGTKGQIDLFKMGCDPITGRRFQHGEQLVAQR
jgi:hypothetical protein